MDLREGSARRLTLAGCVALVVALAACSGGDDAVTTTVVAPADSVSPTTGSPTTVVTSAAGATSATPASTAGTAVPTVAPGDPAAALAVWQDALVRAAQGGDLAPAADTAAVADLAAASAVLAEPLTFATAAAPEGSGFSITDCVLSSLDEATVPLLVRGTVAPGADGTLQVTAFDASEQFTACVPAALNGAVLADYADFWVAFGQFGNPPDPNSARLLETTTGNYRPFAQELMGGLVAAGHEVRGAVAPRPEVIRFVSPTEIVVGDCQVAAPDFGVFDSASGARTEEIPAPHEGQTDYHQATMVLEEGRWKVAEFEGNLDDGCTSPLPNAAVVVGGPA